MICTMFSSISSIKPASRKLWTSESLILTMPLLQLMMLCIDIIVCVIWCGWGRQKMMCAAWSASMSFCNSKLKLMHRYYVFHKF
jgi:hypothetical protein